MSWNISWEVKKEKDRDRPFVVCRWMINREEEDFGFQLLRRMKERKRGRKRKKERKRERKKERKKERDIERKSIIINSINENLNLRK